MQVPAGTRALITGASRASGAPSPVRSPCDVADATSTQTAIERFVDRAGGLDLLIANAGIASYGAFANQSLEDRIRMSRVNWHGTLHTVHFGLPHLLQARNGHIVIVSSSAGLRAFPGAAVYGATKAAQRAFGEALRRELDGTGVSLTVVYPGEIATALHDHEKQRLPAWYRGGQRAAPADALAARIVRAIDNDERAVHHPPLVRALGIAHGLSPKVGDALLRRLRGESAAPRRG